MTDTIIRPPSALSLPQELLDLVPGSDDFNAIIETLNDDDREALVAYLESLSPDATFEALGYTPTIRQWEFHDLPPWSEGGPWDVLYGGAAGGGKTKGMLMDALAWCNRIPGIELWALRATYPELRDSFEAELNNINKAKILGCSYNEGKHTLTFPNGSTLKLRHARTMANAAEMLSAQCQGLYIDERTTMLPKVLEKVGIRVRSGDPSLPIIGIRSGTNPGDVGHMDCKTKFVDPAPMGHCRIRVRARSGRRMDRYFIPAKIGDNPYLDEGYDDRLSMLDPALERAYREGLWDIFEGMAFSEWRPDVHVIDPEDFPLSQGYPLGLGVDYGVSNPFAALWGMKGPDSTIVVYREVYGADHVVTEQCKLILEAEQPWERKRKGGNIQTWLDPACWARQPNSPKPIGHYPPKNSIAETYRNSGLDVHQAYNDRITGKSLVHVGLKHQTATNPDTHELEWVRRPHLLVYSTCVNLIRTLPSLPRDPKKAEDVDTNAEDHAYDALRYLLAGLTGKRRVRTRTYGDEMRNVHAG